MNALGLNIPTLALVIIGCVEMIGFVGERCNLEEDVSGIVWCVKDISGGFWYVIGGVIVFTDIAGDVVSMMGEDIVLTWEIIGVECTCEVMEGICVILWLELEV